MDRASSPAWVRHRGARRGSAARGCVDALRPRSDRVGAPLARRDHLEGAQGMSAPPAAPILLASTSPQRRAILEQLGIPFNVVAPRYEEDDAPGSSPVELVRAHAAGKARSVAALADG